MFLVAFFFCCLLPTLFDDPPVDHLNSFVVVLYKNSSPTWHQKHSPKNEQALVYKNQIIKINYLLCVVQKLFFIKWNERTPFTLSLMSFMNKLLHKCFGNRQWITEENVCVNGQMVFSSLLNFFLLLLLLSSHTFEFLMCNYFAISFVPMPVKLV